MKRVGLIAGGGQFPALFAVRAAERGYQVFAAAYVNEADTELGHHVSAIEWLHIGQVGRLIKFFRKNSVSEAVMMGSVKKTRIFRDIKPDLKAIAFIALQGQTHDDGILRSFADLLEREDIAIRPSTFLLPELLSPKGCWTRRKPDRAEYRDIETGWRIAREIGRLDIGQCVVVANGTVLAIEAADGTDATIKRGAALAHINNRNRGLTAHKRRFTIDRGAFAADHGAFTADHGAFTADHGVGGAVVVKLSKPQQDLRFDLPASGIETIKNMAQFNASVLVLEANRSISFDRSAMITLADRHNISIVAMENGDF